MLIGRDEEGKVLDLSHKHFTTHSLCVGMTGSGKTGFSISILEKLALLKIPALILDPKGDLGNLFLIFPDLKTEDFAPWSEEPEKAAQIWKTNLEKEGIGKEELENLKNSVERRIVTPGLASCSPLNILPSFKAPSPSEMSQNLEEIRERIRNLVSAIFNLIGRQPDPFSDTPFIFLSLCCEHFFKSGKDISLEDLILSLESPPFSSIGVMPLEKVFPLEERRNLAFKLNNLVASPQFSSWFSGIPLNYSEIFYTVEGKPCHNVVYLNHLDDNLKQFAVTLILSELYNFIVKQKGSEDLKYLLYFDEISGFLPPSPSNPPSKAPLLTLLKKARAFGLGVFLATQNPIDLDYRALSNIGIYAIGRLHTQQDKERIKDFIGKDESAMEKISNLKPREFWIKDVKDPRTPMIIKSLQVCSYLKGPMTVEELKIFAKPYEKEKIEDGKRAYFIPSSISIGYDPAGGELFPYFLSEVILFYSKESARISISKNYLILSALEKEGFEWKILHQKPTLVNEKPEGSNLNLDPSMDLEKELKRAEKNLKEKISTLFPLKIYYNSSFKIFSSPEDNLEEFSLKCKEKAMEILKEKLEERRKVYEMKLQRLREQLEKERYFLKKEEQEASLRSTERNINILEAGLSILFGGKGTMTKIRRTLSKASQVGRKERQVEKEKQDVLMRREKIQKLEEELLSLKDEMEKEILEIENQEREKMESIEEILIYPLESKSNIEKISVVFLNKNSLNL